MVACQSKVIGRDSAEDSWGKAARGESLVLVVEKAQWKSCRVYIFESRVAMKELRKRKVGCGRYRANRYVWSRSMSGGYLQKSGEMTDPKEKRSKGAC